MMAEGSHDGLVAVVTGASRGLGAGMAAAFADAGVRLGLCARTRPVEPEGAQAWTASVDVTRADEVDGFAVEVVDRFGAIDLWINNAGVLGPIGPLADADPVELEDNVGINLLGVMHGTATFARHVRYRPGTGVLVNISSGAATSPFVGWAAYCATKAAVEMVTEVVAREEGANGLRAVALSPGVVDTDMQALIRSTPAERFPDVDRFQRLYREGGYNTPAWVAQFILDRFVDGFVRRSPGGGAGGPPPHESNDEVGPVRFRVPDQV